MRGSDKHGPRQDDALAHQVHGEMQGNHSTHAQEWKEGEPSGEDQPDVDLMPNGDLQGGTPDGMSHGDVEGRSDLARNLARAAFPGDRDALITAAQESQAPDAVVAQLERLPAGQQFRNVEEVWEALGGGGEQHRF